MLICIIISVGLSSNPDVRAWLVDRIKEIARAEEEPEPVVVKMKACHKGPAEEVMHICMHVSLCLVMLMHTYMHA